MVFRFMRRIIRALPVLWKYDIIDITIEDTDDMNGDNNINGQIIDSNTINTIIQEWQDRGIIV